MNENEKTTKSRNFLNEGVRGCLAVALSLLLIPYGVPCALAQDAPPPPQQGGYAPPPQGGYVPLGAEQLNQLVAPIALYPDALVAQVLTAATYPQQVADANNWLSQTSYMPPEQRAAAADQMPWDPSVKALTAFPSVLNNMARNYNWTGALGNAYYNQPGDVMNAVQAMRMQAQASGALRSDSHYRVGYNGGLVVIEPINPGVIYVPYYNPWTVWGAPIVPWGGYYWAGPPRGVVLAAGIGIGFAVGISIGLFAHYGWGYHNWAPNWHGGVVVYNHTTYISRSTTVINRGNFGGYNRGVYEHAGPGVPRNFHPPVTSQSAAFRPGQTAPGSFRGSNYATGRPQGTSNGQQFGRATTPTNQPYRPPVQQNTPQTGRQFGQPRTPTTTTPSTQGTYSRTPTTTQGNYSRPTPPQGNYSRPTPTTPQSTYSRPAQNTPPQGTYSRPNTSGGGSYSRPQMSTQPQVHSQGGGNTSRTPPSSSSQHSSGSQHSSQHNNNSHENRH